MTVPNNWLTCFKPNPHATLRLFCFPYAGGRASIFRNWSEDLPANVELHAIELPARGKRIKETPFTRMEPLVQAIADAIEPYLTKPFCFFGHSMGAITGF